MGDQEMNCTGTPEVIRKKDKRGDNISGACVSTKTGSVQLIYNVIHVIKKNS